MGGNLSKISRKGSKGERGEKGDTPNIEFKYDNITGELSFRSNGIMVTSDYIKSRDIITKDNIVDNTILEIVFNDEYIGDKTSQEICQACKAKKKIIGKLDNKTLNFSVIECDVNGNVSLKTLIDNETHEFICSSDNKWSKKLVSLVTEGDFKKAKEEQSKLISANADLISANTKLISNNKDLISNNEKRIDKNEDDISANAGKIEENKKNISSHGTAITNINQDVKNIGESITGLKTDINTLKGKANNTSSELNGVKDDVSSLYSHVNNLKGSKLDKAIWEDFIKSGGTSGIIDLGTFQLIYDEDYNEVVNTTAELGKAIDNARKTGIYSVRYEEGQVQENEYGQEVSRNIFLSETKLIIVIADVSGIHEVVTQVCLTQDNMDNGNNDYISPLKMRKYYYDLEKEKYIWTQYQELENAQFKVNDINEPNIDPMQCYPTVEAVLDLVNKNQGIVDLGTYKIEVDPNTGNLIVNEEPQYREAIDKTLKTGVYKITLIEAGIERPSILIVLGSVDFNGKELITQYSFSDNPFSPADYLDLPLPKIRKYYYSTIDNKYIWTDGAYFNSESIFQTTTHMEHNENYFDFWSENDYPSVAAVVRYVDKKLQPQAPVTTVPDVLKPNTEYNFGLQSTLNLSFPIDTEDGDVICIRFISTETPTNLVIDMSNVIDFELIPEKNTWYEICAKYDSQLLLWVLAYSEYMYMGG